MDLRELASFRAVAELGAISKAAAYLRIAQPALSRQIQKLEHSLGVELLQRTSKGVVPTAAGRLLLDRTERLEADLDEIQREVASLSSQVGGALHVAVQGPLAIQVAPAVLADYRAEHPGVLLHILDGYSADLTDGLLSGTLDVAVVDAPSHVHGDVRVTLLWIDTLRLVGPAGDPRWAGLGTGPVPLSAIAALPLILTSRRYALRRLIDAVFARERTRPEPVVEADGPALIFAMVKARLGFTLMPTNGRQTVLDDTDLRVVETTPFIRRPVSIVTRTAMQSERKVETFVRLFTAATARAVAEKRFGDVHWIGGGEN